jgi:hypothetical protein
MESKISDRIITKLTSTKTWFLIAAILTATASYVGGATFAIPDWLCQTGLICGFAGGGIYAIVTAYQNAKEALASSTQTTNSLSTIVQATSSDSGTVEKIAKIDTPTDDTAIKDAASNAAANAAQAVADAAQAAVSAVQ